MFRDHGFSRKSGNDVKVPQLIHHDPQENGVDTAIQCIYRDLEYATSLVRAKTNRNQSARAAQAEALAAASGKNTSQATASSTGGTATTSTTTVTEPSVVVGSADAADDDVEDDDEEESWTFVGRQPEDGDLGPATFVARQNLDEVVVRKTEALARDNTVGTTRSDH